MVRGGSVPLRHKEENDNGIIQETVPSLPEEVGPTLYVHV